MLEALGVWGFGVQGITLLDLFVKGLRFRAS